MRLALLVGVFAVSWARPARADNDLANYSIGPVFAIKLGGHGDWPVLGLEAGAGYGPERINLGFEHRADHDAGYIELDPWYIVGGSLGFAVDDEGKTHGVGGVWEGVPIAGFDGGCSGWQNMVTLAGGYRYTGVHELFVTVKAGRIDGKPCFD
jgi:hypothetical protein